MSFVPKPNASPVTGLLDIDSYDDEDLEDLFVPPPPSPRTGHASDSDSLGLFSSDDDVNDDDFEASNGDVKPAAVPKTNNNGTTAPIDDDTKLVAAPSKMKRELSNENLPPASSEKKLKTEHFESSSFAQRKLTTAYLSSEKYDRAEEDDDDDELSINHVTEAASNQDSDSSSEGDDGDDDDDLIEIIGTTGRNPLEDFPHGREHCVRFLFQQDPALYCANCYCYVCDAPVKDCPKWTVHCQATRTDHRWRNARIEHKLLTAPPAAAPAPPFAGPLAHHPGQVQNHGGPLYRRITPALVQKLLEVVTRVYPSEHTPQTPFQTKLRHYQKQSLAFMMDVEQSGTTWKADDTKRTYGPVENQSRPCLIATRGGWLCSEVGMGKSAVVVALVASSTFNPSRPTFQGRTLVKGTVIMTSASLLGQWEDECKKHAPHLQVIRFHPSSQKSIKTRKAAERGLYTADIIVSTATFKWGNILDSLVFQRVVMDESHLFNGRRESADPLKASMIPAPLRWCVTATPMAASAGELVSQCKFLHMPADLTVALQESPDALKKHMIRHTKSQPIGGSKALALPKVNTTITMVAMTQDERTKYEAAIRDNIRQLRRLKRRVECGWFYLTNTVLYNLSGPMISADSSKVQKLEKALLNLQSREPNMRAVVFTQLRRVCHHINTMVKKHGFQLYSFTGTTAAKQRDMAIREFQAAKTTGPAVFVITTGAGSVGITLTAASHVFLMEPCVNPSDEVQMAGRIHRLGQTKQVFVTKFVYDYSFESNILELHDEIDEGNIGFTNDGVGTEALKVLLKDIC